MGNHGFFQLGRGEEAPPRERQPGAAHHQGGGDRAKVRVVEEKFQNRERYCFQDDDAFLTKTEYKK